MTPKLKENMNDYTNLNRSHIAIRWDNIQETFHCCGLESSEDWMNAVRGIPLSCCDIPHGQLDNFHCDSTQATMHDKGCLEAFGSFIKSHAMSLAIAGLVLAIIQLFGLLFACLIARQIKKNRGF